MKGLQGTIGRYPILGHWASGRTSEVYSVRARSPEGAEVIRALKLVTMTGLSNRVREDLVVRLRGLTRIDHPMVLRVHDVFEHEGALAIVSDFVAGESLAHVLAAEGGALSTNLALGIIMELATSLQELSDWRGSGSGLLIHGDLCPSNVMVTYRGELMVVDHGLALGEMRAARDGRIRGHVGYFSPERASRSTDIDMRTDVYSAGLMLWEMLVGLPALQGKDETTLLQQARRAEIPPPSTRVRVSASIDSLVAKAIAHAVTDRIGSMGELAEALSGLLIARRPSWDTRAELEKLMQRRFEHRERATQKIQERWSSALASKRVATESRSVAQGSAASQGRGMTTTAEPIPERARRSDDLVGRGARPDATPSVPTAAYLPAQSREAAMPRFFGDAALAAALPFDLATEDLPGSTGDLRAPASPRSSVLRGLLIILAGAISAITVIMLLPATWRSSADLIGDQIEGQLVAVLGAIVRWLVNRVF